jgi:hypothetical protein
LLTSVIYVYKLIYYSCFDFRKGFLQIIPLLLQNTLVNNIKLFLNYTISKLFSFMIIYLYCFFFYIIINMFFVDHYIFFQHLPESTIYEYKFFENYFFLKKYIINIYYVLFFLTVNVLILNTWRSNFFYYDTFELFLNLWGFFCSVHIIRGILKLIDNYVSILSLYL